MRISKVLLIGAVVSVVGLTGCKDKPQIKQSPLVEYKYEFTPNRSLYQAKLLEIEIIFGAEGRKGFEILAQKGLGVDRTFSTMLHHPLLIKFLGGGKPPKVQEEHLYGSTEVLFGSRKL
ncbi:hypothetical protein HZC08_01330, partial [Candidatus Micrarchaeota archaeon]|nr:hypothetical protein [Candidatus Micrarchaeota archaeon]